MIELLGTVVENQAKHDADLVAHAGVLAQGLIKGNDNLAGLQALLIEKLPELADGTRQYGRKMVRPVGETCSKIAQFADTNEPSVITEEDAEVIRGGTEMEVDPMAPVKINQISEINIKTGHCIVDVDGVPVVGKITDPVLTKPGNVYTQALNEHAGLTVLAKAVRKSGNLHRLYISDTVES